MCHRTSPTTTTTTTPSRPSGRPLFAAATNLDIYLHSLHIGAISAQKEKERKKEEKSKD